MNVALDTLSSFQQEKLEYYFKFFEPSAHSQLDNTSLDHFMKRVLEFTGWNPQSAEARSLREVHEAFFEVLFEKTSESDKKGRLAVCGANVIHGCKGPNNFPVWLRLLPKTLFRMMDRDGDKLIEEEELFNFYHYMVKLPAQEARSNSHLAFSQMTDAYISVTNRMAVTLLNEGSYEQIFSNFLLGRTPHGPGRHIFGCFEHSANQMTFKLIQPAPESDNENIDIHVYQEKRPKKRNMTGL